MKIDYFCFSVPSLNTTDFVIEDTDSENVRWIKEQDMALMESVCEKDMLIVFDRETKKFYDKRGEIDVQGKVIFPRCFIPYASEFMAALQDARAISIQTEEDCEKITNWPNFIQPVHRQVISTTYGEFQENCEKYRTIFKSLFFKTALKTHTHCILDYYGHIDVGGEKLFFSKPPVWHVAPNDSVFLSEAFERIEDKENEMSCREYRVFVLDHELLSISRSYVDYPTEVPDEVRIFVEEQIKRASLIPGFPRSYVLDVGQMKVNGAPVVDIIEYNPIASSGLEVCNQLTDALLKRNSMLRARAKKEESIE